MTLLAFLESIRTPLGERICLLLTGLGTEYAFMAVALFVLWCVDRRWGFRMFPLYFAGMVGSEVGKSLLKTPRPFVRDPGLHPVPAALETAEGYSCPSGHSFSAGAIFFGAATFFRRWWVRLLLALPVLLTMFSRMYLGVHTLTDVLVGAGLALALTVGFTFLYRWIDRRGKGDGWVYGILLIVSAVATLVTVTHWFGGSEGAANAPKLLGCSAGLFAAWFLDARRGAPAMPNGWVSKLTCYVPGMAVCLGLLKGLKALFGLIVPDLWVLHAVRYGLVILAAATGWPWIWQKAGSKFRKSH